MRLAWIHRPPTIENPPAFFSLFSEATLQFMRSLSSLILSLADVLCLQRSMLNRVLNLSRYTPGLTLFRQPGLPFVTVFFLLVKEKICVVCLTVRKHGCACVGDWVVRASALFAELFPDFYSLSDFFAHASACRSISLDLSTLLCLSV